MPLIFDIEDELYIRGGIGFSTLSHLESIGLVNVQAAISIERAGLRRSVVASYFGNSLELTLPRASGNSLSTGHVILTQMGAELVPICGAEPNDAFFEHVVQRWRGSGFLTPPAEAVDAGVPAG